MPRRVLSVDTGYDDDLRWFASEREEFYAREKRTVDQIQQSDASNSSFMEKCRQRRNGVPVYDALAICTHGETGRIYDFRGDIRRELFSTTSPPEDLQVIGESRCVYVFACDTARSTLPDRMLQNGTSIFVGFSESPSWQSSAVRRHWRDIDLAFLEAVLEDGNVATFQRIQGDRLRRLEALAKSKEHKSDAPDLAKMAEVVSSMVIIER